MSTMTETFWVFVWSSLYSQHLESTLIIHIVKLNQVRLEKRKKRQVGKKRQWWGGKRQKEGRERIRQEQKLKKE